MYTFRAPRIEIDQRFDSESAMVICGENEHYQVQIQDSHNTNIRLLQDTPDPSCAPQAELADLARQVNNFFEGKAKALLEAKRKGLKSPQNLEVTVLLTDRGIQLAYAYGLDRKEVAPMPRKSFLRRLLGPLYPVRNFWSMPDHHTKPNPVVKVWWPSLLWALVLLALAALPFFYDGNGGITGFHLPWDDAPTKS